MTSLIQNTSHDIHFKTINSPKTHKITNDNKKTLNEINNEVNKAGKDSSTAENNSNNKIVDVTTDNFDKYFKSYLKNRRHNDYLQFKQSSIESKEIISNEINALLSNIGDIETKQVILSHTPALSLPSLVYINDSRLKQTYKLLYTEEQNSNNESFRKKQKFNYKLLDDSSPEKMYFNWKYIQPIHKTFRTESNTYINNSHKKGPINDLTKKSVKDKDRIIKIPSPIKKANDSWNNLNTTTEIAKSSIDSVELPTIKRQIKFKNNTNKKSMINALRKNSKIKAIKYFSTNIINSSDNLSNTMNSMKQSRLNFNENIDDNKVKAENSDDKQNKLTDETLNDFDNSFIDQKSIIKEQKNSQEDTSSSIGSYSSGKGLNGAVLDLFEEGNTNMDLRNLDDGKNEGTKPGESSKLINSKIAFQRTKSWIESHEFFFEQV